MTTTTHQANDSVVVTSDHRYWVAITLIGDNVGEHRAIYRHESNESAIARLTALLNLQPLAHVEEKRVLDIDQPVSIGYTIFLRPQVWRTIYEVT